MRCWLEMCGSEGGVAGLSLRSMRMTAMRRKRALQRFAGIKIAELRPMCDTRDPHQDRPAASVTVIRATTILPKTEQQKFDRSAQLLER